MKRIFAFLVRHKIEALGLVLLFLMGFVMILSVKDDTYITDELAYIPAGYTSLVDRHLRLDFEHPPLAKDLMALPLLFINLRPPSEIPILDIGDVAHGAQWNFGSTFLFNQTESIEQILFLGRLPMILLTLLLGFLVFLWTKKLWGNRVGFFALFLFIFSPTILAHGRFATLDIVSTLGAFVAIYYFVKFLKEPSNKNSIIAGITLGIAELVKFSLLLLFPVFLILVLVWIWAHSSGLKMALVKFLDYLPKLVSILIICFIAIFVVYQYHIWNYPKEQQAEDIQAVLSSTKFSSLVPPLVKLSQIEGMRPLAHYVLGVSWQLSRTGAVNYFNGEGSFGGRFSYFPTAYLIKETIPLHVFTLLGLWYFVGRFIRERPLKIKRWRKKIKLLISQKFFAVAATTWIISYLFVMVFVNQINIGIRYLLPVFPFLFMFVALGAVRWLGGAKKHKFKIILFGILIVWQIVSVANVYPSFLAYFNELIGGPTNGYKYLVDSNLDWGQDAKRLAGWVTERGIEKIKIPDRFSIVSAGASGSEFWYSRSYEFYLEDKYEYLPEAAPTTGWVAVPATLLQWGRANPAEKSGWSSDSYRWLDAYEPVAKIGYSIFVYYIDDIEPGIRANYEAKLESARRMVDTDQSSQNFFNVGFYAIKAGNFKEAIEANKWVIRLDPNDAAAYNNLGTAYNNLQEWDKAIVALEKALELNPELELARNNLIVAKEGLFFEASAN